MKAIYTQKDIRKWIDALKIMKEERDLLLMDKIRLLEEMLSMCEDSAYADAVLQELVETRKKIK